MGRRSVKSWCPPHLLRQRAAWKRLCRYFAENQNLKVGESAVAAGQAYMRALCEYLEGR